MENHYHFYSLNKIPRSAFLEAIGQKYTGTFKWQFVSDHQGFILASDAFFDPLENMLSILNQDLGLRLTFLVAHTRSPLTDHCLLLAAKKSINNCLYLGDFLWDLALQGDRRFKSLVQQEFSKLSRELLLTASVFLRSGLNASKTASKLYIHRNTFNYRLNRFIQFTGLDIRDFHHALYFQLALKWLE